MQYLFIYNPYCMICIDNVTICAEIHEEFNKINRFWIAYTEQEIGAIIQTSVFCVDNII